jgi:hypothetical protein
MKNKRRTRQSSRKFWRQRKSNKKLINRSRQLKINWIKKCKMGKARVNNSRSQSKKKTCNQNWGQRAGKLSSRKCQRKKPSQRIRRSQRNSKVNS